MGFFSKILNGCQLFFTQLTAMPQKKKAKKNKKQKTKTTAKTKTKQNKKLSNYQIK